MKPRSLRIRGALPESHADDRATGCCGYIANSVDHMPRRKADSHLYELAKRGAEVRLRELVQEARNVIDLFPHLRDSYDRDELPVSFIIRRDADRATRASAAHRPRRRMSAAARKAVSERMKRYWGARRKMAKA